MLWRGTDRAGRHSGSRPAAFLLVVGVTLAAVGAGWWWTGQHSSDEAAAAAAGAVSSAARTAAPPPPPERRVPWRAGAPRRLVVPALGVDAPVVPVGLVGRTLVPPRDPQVLGWWAGGALPGARHGAALLSGHTVHTGGGALDHLGRVHPGDRIMVRTDRGRLVYRATRVDVVGKQGLADRAPELFGAGGAGRLVLVTCSGWDGSGYRSSVVVVARPVR